MYDPRDRRDREEEENDDDRYYISADGRVHSTPQGAVQASLEFEEISNTGAGCPQDPGDVVEQ